MDVDLQKKINEVVEHLQLMMSDTVEYELMDPIAKMMLVALLYETQKITDYIDAFDRKLAERFYEDFIPLRQVGAMPAIALVSPTFKKKSGDCVQINSGVSFSFKEKFSKNAINYLPIFKNTLVPYDDIHVLTKNVFKSKGNTYAVSLEQSNILWVGIQTKAEIESLEGFSLLIKTKHKVSPRKISVLSQETEPLAFCTMSKMEDIEMLEPFDAQQVSNKFLSIINYWKELLQDIPNGVLITVTDKTNNRDRYKTRSFSRVFQSLLESRELDLLKDEALWLQIEFPDDFVVDDDCEVVLNAVPIANVDVNTVTLTQSAPIAKLQKQDDSFFLTILETSNAAHKQGFSMSADEFVVRDFDAHCYHNGDLYRDVRNLYNRFVEDYHAFIDYNGLKDGQDIKRLKELVNKIAKSVGEKNDKYKYDSGTYVMKNIKHSAGSMITKVLFLTTQGALGNNLKDTSAGVDAASSKLECKKLPVIESAVPVIVSAMGGKDKATADSRYELLRYYSLTRDRLFTRMDVDAYVRKELVAIYGKEEFKRIMVDVHVEGAGGGDSVRRGLYVDIEFKDRKNFEKAVELSISEILVDGITKHGCFSLPIFVNTNVKD